MALVPDTNAVDATKAATITAGRSTFSFHRTGAGTTTIITTTTISITTATTDASPAQPWSGGCP